MIIHKKRNPTPNGKLKTSIYFTQESLDLLEKLSWESHKSHSDILNTSLWYYAELKTHVKEIFKEIEQETRVARNEELRMILREESEARSHS